MYSVSGSARDLEMSITSLKKNYTAKDNEKIDNAIDTLATVVNPVLRFLQGTPIRAIIVTVVVSLRTNNHLIFKLCSAGPARPSPIQQNERATN